MKNQTDLHMSFEKHFGHTESMREAEFDMIDKLFLKALLKPLQPKIYLSSTPHIEVNGVKHFIKKYEDSTSFTLMRPFNLKLKEYPTTYVEPFRLEKGTILCKTQNRQFWMVDLFKFLGIEKIKYIPCHKIRFDVKPITRYELV